MYADVFVDFYFSNIFPSLYSKTDSKPPEPIDKALYLRIGDTIESLNSNHYSSKDGLINA
jgi:hypothetical protein